MAVPCTRPPLTAPVLYTVFQQDRRQLMGIVNADPSVTKAQAVAGLLGDMDFCIEKMPYYITDSGTFVDIGDDEDERSLLEKIFHSNQNEARSDPRRWPSMAMGDVVCLGEQFWLCAFTGWEHMPHAPKNLDFKGMA